MKYKRIPQIDQDISLLGLGTWNISGQWKDQDDAEAVRMIHAALAGGINFIDTAPIYGKGHSEELLGKALQQGRREKVFLATKCGLQWNQKGKVRHDLSRKALTQELEDILTRLSTDRIDLLQIHWPNKKYPLEETMATLEDFRLQGKIRYIGVSNFSVEELTLARTITPVATYQGLFNILEQNAEEYHRNPLPYRSQSEIFPLMEKWGMGFIPYSPLMQGVLTGKYTSKEQFKGDLRWSNPKIRDEGLEESLILVRELEMIAKKHGLSLITLVLQWTMAQKEVLSVITGARRVSQVEKNIELVSENLSEKCFFDIKVFLNKYIS